MPHRRVILLAGLGAFSGTNDSVFEQLVKNFVDFRIERFTAYDHVRPRLHRMVRGFLNELLEYGPSAFARRSDRTNLFWKTPYLFDIMSKLARDEALSHGRNLAAVVQTQGLFTSKISDVPLIVYTDYTMRSDDGGRSRFRPSARLIEREARLFREADAVAGTATHVRDVLTTEYGCDPHRLSTVYIGSNVPVSQVDVSLHRYQQAKILFVGIDWTRKGGPDLVEAFSHVSKAFPHASLTIVGCNPDVHHPRIRVLGRLDRANVSRLYADHSIFCLPSLVEPSSVAVIEATNAKLPIVATTVGGFRDSVTDGVTGLLVPPSNPGKLADALARLLADPDAACRFGEAGFQQNRVRFSWDEVGALLAEQITIRISDPPRLPGSLDA